MASEYLSVYGNPQPTTPHLKKLAEEKGVSSRTSTSRPVQLQEHSLIDRRRVSPHRLEADRLPARRLRRPAHQRCSKTAAIAVAMHSGYWAGTIGIVICAPRAEPTIIDAENAFGRSDQQLGSWRSGHVRLLPGMDRRGPRQPFFLVAYTLETHHPYATRTPRIRSTSPPTIRTTTSTPSGPPTSGSSSSWSSWRSATAGRHLVVVTADHGEAFGQHNQRATTSAFTSRTSTSVDPVPSQHGEHGQATKAGSRTNRPAGDHPGVDRRPTPNVWQGRNLFRPGDGRPPTSSASAIRSYSDSATAT